jgi:hypothetical protein
MKKYRSLQECYKSIYEQLAPSTEVSTDPNQGAKSDPNQISQDMGQLAAAVKSLAKEQSDSILTQILGSVMEGSSEKLVQAISSISQMGNQLARTTAFQPQNLQQTLNRMFTNRPNVAETMKGAQQGSSQQQSSSPGQSIANTIQGTVNTKPPTAQSLGIMGS